MADPAILNTAYVLAHAPDFVRHGSKPTRELAADPSLLPQVAAALRPWDEVVAYPPNQVFIGNLTPDDLAATPRPWTDHPVADASTQGPFGRIVTQETLYGLMMLCDDFDLMTITESLAAKASTTPNTTNNASKNADRRVERKFSFKKQAVGSNIKFFVQTVAMTNHGSNLFDAQIPGQVTRIKPRSPDINGVGSAV